MLLCGLNNAAKIIKKAICTQAVRKQPLIYDRFHAKRDKFAETRCNSIKCNSDFALSSNRARESRATAGTLERLKRGIANYKD